MYMMNLYYAEELSWKQCVYTLFTKFTTIDEEMGLIIKNRNTELKR